MWLGFIALCILSSFAFIFFHHHADGDHPHDCTVCHFVQQIFAAFFAALLVLIFALLETKNFFVLVQRFKSLLLFSSLQGRAPPSLIV